jgi:hypothetical protein
VVVLRIAAASVKQESARTNQLVGSGVVDWKEGAADDQSDLLG